MLTNNVKHNWRRLLQMNAFKFTKLKNGKIKYVLEKTEREEATITQSGFIYDPAGYKVIGHKTFIRLPEEITHEQLEADFKSIRKRKYWMTKKYFSGQSNR